MHSLLSLSPHPTAVLVSDDQMAMGAMRSALEAGLRIPQDVTITGFDGIEMAMYTYPALTTVRQPIEEMGRRTIQTVLNQIDGKQIPADEMFVEIKPELILRESTGPAPQN
jgi:DNA-binding LacI/PurR family transcriptional regulator